MSSKDVVRHPLVQKIVEAYEKYEKKTAVKEAEAAHKKKAGRKR